MRITNITVNTKIKKPIYNIESKTKTNYNGNNKSNLQKNYILKT